MNNKQYWIVYYKFSWVPDTYNGYPDNEILDTEEEIIRKVKDLLEEGHVILAVRKVTETPVPDEKLQEWGIKPL